MELTLKILILFLMVSVFGISPGKSLRVIGHTEEDFETDLSYITRFVFRPGAMGRLQYSMKIPANDCCSDLVLFNGWKHQWPLIRDYGHQMTCFEKLDLIPGIQSTIYPLMATSGIHRCKFITEANGEEKLHCFGDRRFRHPQPQWYYFTFMNCHYRSHSGINVTYDLHMTNGHEGALIEFSADEDANLPVTLVCDVILLCCVLSGIVFAVILYSRKMLHTTYKIWFVSLCLHFTGCIIMSVAWYKFAWDGFERKKEVALGHYFTSAGSIVFAVLMIVVSKGYTITRLTIRSIGKMKIGAFTCWFSFCYMMLYIILEQSDPRDVRNIYDTPAALGIVGMRIGACIWCLYGALFTLKDFPLKRSFYIFFAILSSSWFLAEPIMILFSNFWLPLYCRAKWVHAVYLITLVFGHVVFVLLTRPSATNTYFPFHLSTNKVGIAESLERGNSDESVTSKATFANFLVVSEIPEERKATPTSKELTSASSSLSSEKEASDTSFDLFMATSESAEDKQKTIHSPAVPSTEPKSVSSSLSSENRPSKGKFDVFMAASERAKMQEQKTIPSIKPKSVSSSLSSENRPSKGKFDVFMAASERAKMQEQKTVPSISGSVSMTTMINCPIQSLSHLPITDLTSYSASSDSLDKEDDWTKLVSENIDAPKGTDSDQKKDSSKAAEYPAPRPKNLPVTYQQTKYVPSLSTQNNPALSGQHGMYALADSDESNSSSEEECDEVDHIVKVRSTFKNIKLKPQEKADKPKTAHPPSEKKQQSVTAVTHKQTKEVPAEPEYEVVPPSSKVRVIYVKPAEAPAIQFRPTRAESFKNKIPNAPAAACSEHVSDAANISAPDNNIPGEEHHNVSYHITNQSNHQGRSRERVVKRASDKAKADKRHSSSVDQRRSKEHVQIPPEAKTSKTTFKSTTDLQTADEERRSKNKQQKNAVEEVMEVEDLEEIYLPSTSKDDAFSDAVQKTKDEEVMEVEDLEVEDLDEICLPVSSTYHQRSRASMKHSVLQIKNMFQSDTKTIEDTETINSKEMERGRQRERQVQECRSQTKYREISTADRYRPSVTVYSTTSGAQNFQEQAPYVEKTNTEPRTSSAYLAVGKEEETQQQSVQTSKHRGHYVSAEEGEQKYNSQRRAKHHKPSVTTVTVENEQEHQAMSQKHGKLFSGQTASESLPETEVCAQPSVRRKKSRKIQSSKLRAVGDAIEEVPEKQGKLFSGRTASEDHLESGVCAQPSVRRKKSHKIQSSEVCSVEYVNEDVMESQEQGTHCGQTAPENNQSEVASYEPAVRRKKSRKTQRSELSIEDVIEQVPESQKSRKQHVLSNIKKELHRADEPSPGSQKKTKHHGGGALSKYMGDKEQDQYVLDVAETMDDRRRRILKMKATLEREELEYRKKLTRQSAGSSLEPANDEESKRNKRRREVPAARKMLGINNTSEQE